MKSFRNENVWYKRNHKKRFRKKKCQAPFSGTYVKIRLRDQRTYNTNRFIAERPVVINGIYDDCFSLLTTSQNTKTLPEQFRTGSDRWQCARVKTACTTQNKCNRGKIRRCWSEKELNVLRNEQWRHDKQIFLLVFPCTYTVYMVFFTCSIISQPFTRCRLSWFSISHIPYAYYDKVLIHCSN